MNDYLNTFTSHLLNYLDQGVFFINIEKNLVYWNKSAETLLGYQSAELSNHKCCQLTTHIGLNGESLCSEHCPITKAIQEGQPQEEDMFIVHKDGHTILAKVTTVPVYNKVGQLVGVIELISNNALKGIGQEKIKALTKAAFMDSTSELFSKQYIETRLQTMFKESPEKRESFGILYINIVGFRAINEMYGASRADRILKSVAKILSSGITHPTIIGRWHGASFIVILDTAKKSLMLLLADKLKKLISETSLQIGDQNVEITVSIGHAISQSNDSIDYLIERATKDSLVENVKEAAPELPSIISPPNSSKQSKTSGFHSILPKSK